MSITKNSLFLQAIVALWLGLKRAGDSSLLVRGLDRLGARVCRVLEGSALWGFLWRQGTVPKAWPHSLSCRLFTGLVNLPCALVKWLYRLGRPLCDGSWFCGLLVTYDDADSMSAAMARFLEDPAFLSRCRERALATVQEKFEIHDMARKTYAVYEKAMGTESKE